MSTVNELLETIGSLQQDLADAEAHLEHVHRELHQAQAEQREAAAAYLAMQKTSEDVHRRELEQAHKDKDFAQTKWNECTLALKENMTTIQRLTTELEQAQATIVQQNLENERAAQGLKLAEHDRDAEREAAEALAAQFAKALVDK